MKLRQEVTKRQLSHFARPLRFLSGVVQSGVVFFDCLCDPTSKKSGTTLFSCAVDGSNQTILDSSSLTTVATKQNILWCWSFR